MSAIAWQGSTDVSEAFRRRYADRIEVAEVMTGAPIAFAMAVLLVGGLLFFLIKGHFSERIGALEATIGHKQSLLDEYKDRLHGATPLEVQKKITDLEGQVAALDRRVNRPRRRLSEETHAAISRKLQQELADNPDLWAARLVMLNSSPDTDSSRYCVQIGKSLTDGGLSVVSHFAVGRHDEGEYGITFYCPDLENNIQFAKLAMILEDCGLAIARRSDPNNPEATYIFVTPDED